MDLLSVARLDQKMTKNGYSRTDNQSLSYQYSQRSCLVGEVCPSVWQFWWRSSINHYTIWLDMWMKSTWYGWKRQMDCRISCTEREIQWLPDISHRNPFTTSMSSYIQALEQKSNLRQWRKHISKRGSKIINKHIEAVLSMAATLFHRHGPIYLHRPWYYLQTRSIFTLTPFLYAIVYLWFRNTLLNKPKTNA